MIRLSSSIPSLILLSVTAIAVGSVWREFDLLMAHGGWFAVLGQFMAVTATLAILILLVVFAVSLVVLPVILYFGFADPRTLETLTLRRVVHLGGQAVYLLADRLWKFLWRCGHWLRT